MATDDPRCPYCVQGNEFALLHPLGEAFVCDLCGHIVRSSNPDFQCGCAKCRRLRGGIITNERTGA